MLLFSVVKVIRKMLRINVIWQRDQIVCLYNSYKASALVVVKLVFISSVHVHVFGTSQIVVICEDIKDNFQSIKLK